MCCCMVYAHCTVRKFKCKKQQLRDQCRCCEMPSMKIRGFQGKNKIKRCDRDNSLKNEILYGAISV